MINNQYISPYTNEMVEWLKLNVPSADSWEDITLRFNKAFNTKKTKETLSAKCSNMKFKRNYQFTEEQKQFVFDNYKTHSREEMIEMFSKRYYKINSFKMENFYAKYKLLSPKKLHKKNNWQVGISKEEYLSHFSKKGLDKMKYCMSKSDSHICTDTWKKYYGEIPKGYCITRKNNDLPYDDINNLILMNKNDTSNICYYQKKLNASNESKITEGIKSFLVIKRIIKEFENDK